MSLRLLRLRDGKVEWTRWLSMGNLPTTRRFSAGTDRRSGSRQTTSYMLRNSVASRKVAGMKARHCSALNAASFLGGSGIDAEWPYGLEFVIPSDRQMAEIMGEMSRGFRRSSRIADDHSDPRVRSLFKRAFSDRAAHDLRRRPPQQWPPAPAGIRTAPHGQDAA